MNNKQQTPDEGLLAEVEKILKYYFSDTPGEESGDDIAKEILAKAKPILKAEGAKEERESILKLVDKYVPGRFMAGIVQALKGEK